MKAAAAPAHSEISQAKLGAWGELKVQRDLLLLDIDSARMTTDTGVDLVAYKTTPEVRLRFTVQVKTRTPRGMCYSWGVDEAKVDDVDLFALVIRDMHEISGDGEAVWYLTQRDFDESSEPIGGLRRVKFRRDDVGTARFRPQTAYSKYRGLDGLRRALTQLAADREV